MDGIAATPVLLRASVLGGRGLVSSKDEFQLVPKAVAELIVAKAFLEQSVFA